MLRGRWRSPTGNDEYALCFDAQRVRRVLVIPALFDEGNKLRRFTVEVMRQLDTAGVDGLLPDLPGTNESLASLAEQSLDGWRDAIAAAARHFGATHVLAIRGGTLLDPGTLPGIRYAGLTGPSLLRAMARVQVIADKEAGLNSTREQLLDTGQSEGVSLAGYTLGAAMVTQLLDAPLPESAARDIRQPEVGGPGLWLRAEPDHDPQQADKLAAIVLEQLA